MLPQMQGALYPYADEISFVRLEKTVVDGEVVEKKILDCVFNGVLEPIPPRKLMIKPEGQRSWRWWTLWTEQDLKIDWIVQDDEGVTYRVMTKTNWKQAGYYEYELTQGVPNE